MMPELGKYAFAVLASYGVSLALLMALLLVTLRRGRNARRALDAVEDRTRRDG